MITRSSAPLTDKEREFLQLQRKPRLYSIWAEACRKAWTEARTQSMLQSGASRVESPRGKRR